MPNLQPSSAVATVPTKVSHAKNEISLIEISLVGRPAFSCFVISAETNRIKDLLEHDGKSANGKFFGLQNSSYFQLTKITEIQMLRVAKSIWIKPNAELSVSSNQTLHLRTN
jgi:hypothetical protein